MHGFNPEVYYRELLDRMQSLPGVEAASLSHFSPLFTAPYDEELRPARSPAASAIRAPVEHVSDGFLNVLRIPLLQGRDFQRTDSPLSPKAVIVRESLAKRLFPAGDALGHHISVGSKKETENLEIIGLAADTRLMDPRTSNFDFVYLDSWQYPDRLMWGDVQLRYRGDSKALIAAVRRELRNAGREYPLHLRTIAEQRDNALLQESLLAALSAAFGVLSLTLAGVGLFGLLNLLVTSRSSEIAGAP
jgi:ABC-type antimicrobial peptide transport system permease subunit